MRRVERLVGNPVRIGARIQNGRVVHARALVAARRDVLHARGQVLRVVLRQADAFVLLRVGQARVHGKQETGVVANGIEGVRLARTPRRLERQQQAGARGSPQIFGQQRTARAEQVCVFLQAVARKLQGAIASGRALAGTRNPIAAADLTRHVATRAGLAATRNARSQLIGGQLRLHHAIGILTRHAVVTQRKPHRVHFAAHGVRHHGEPPAHARGPRAPRHRVERGGAHERHAERRRDALGRGHGDAHARERPGAAPDAHARQFLARDAGIGEQLVDARQQLRVRRPMGLHLQRCDQLHLPRGGVQAAHADGDHFVGGIECEHVCGFSHVHPL